jgi:diguanylate cyclase (GGDEF)-like protein
MGHDQDRRAGPPVGPRLQAGSIVSQMARATGLDQRGAIRFTAWHGTIAPTVAIFYVAATRHQPNRPAMLALALLLLATALAIWAAASTLARGPGFRAASRLGIFVHIGGYAGLTYLDGGVFGPIGGLVFFLVAFVAVTVPYRAFVPVAAASTAAYAVVAVVGPDSPRGYAPAVACTYLAVSVLLARHARALTSLRRRLTEIVRIDPLTNCLNRRGFDERLVDEVTRSGRTGRPVSLIVIDLDSFKAVNDAFGHHVGDDVLAWTGQALKDTVDAGHLVARVGGDEFAVILPGVDAATAALLSDRLRAVLDEASPASIGHCTHPVEAGDVEGLQALADRRLYADKRLRAQARGPDSAATAADRSSRPASNPAKVSSVERRQQSVTDSGSIAAVNFGVGLVYVLTRPGRLDPWLVASLVPGLLISVTAILMAERIVRRRRARLAWTVAGPSLLVFASVAAVLDGGVDSVISLGILNPLIVLSLALPRGIVVRMAAVVVTTFVAMGVLVGAPSGWYVAFHVTGVLVVSGTCIHQARVAGLRRQLLTRMSRTDSLTGCLNRRGFEERFDEELDRANRRGAPLSIAIVDLDGFKALNDTLGHAAGDELLTWVGTTLDDTTRAHDVVGRLGGDEFIVLLPDCPATEAQVIVNRIDAALRSRASASVGTSTLGAVGRDLDSLYRQADAALYDHKARLTADPQRPAAATTSTGRSRTSASRPDRSPAA